MKEWGLANVHTEAWPFGRGWQNQRFVAIAITPRAFPLIGVPEGVDARHERPGDGRRGDRGHREREGLRPVRASCAASSSSTDADARGDGALRALGHRYTDAELAGSATAARHVAAAARRVGFTPERREFERKKTQFFVDEGVAALVEPSRGDGGTFFVAVRRVARSEGPAGRAAGRARRRALRPHRAHAREEDPGHAADGHRQHVLRPGPELVQHPRRAAGHRQGRRGRDARRALRLVARRHGRDRQRGRLGRDDGGDADPEGERR